VGLSRRELLALGAAGLVRAQDDVSDGTGQTLAELKKEDFRVFEDGREEAIVNFSFDQEPLDLILLFDIGGNMRSKLLQTLRAVELGFHELRAGDRGSVMAFSGTTVVLTPFTQNLSTVNDAILLGVVGQRFGGSSKTIQAVDEAALRARAETGTGRRRAILLVTDKPIGRQPGQDAALRELWQSDAVLSELLLLDRAPDPPDATVEKTGGAAIASGRDPGAAFQESLRRLRRRYTLYYPFHDGPVAERSIRVELTADAAKRFPRARVSARTGYTDR